MNELINNLRLDAGIAKLKDDPRLVVIDREGNVIDPLIGLGKFAELIVKEMCDVFDKRAEPSTGFYEPHEPAELIREHFGVEE